MAMISSSHERERKIIQYRKVFTHKHDNFIQNGRHEVKVNRANTIMMRPEYMVYPYHILLW